MVKKYGGYSKTVNQTGSDESDGSVLYFLTLMETLYAEDTVSPISAGAGILTILQSKLIAVLKSVHYQRKRKGFC